MREVPVRAVEGAVGVEPKAGDIIEWIPGQLVALEQLLPTIQQVETTRCTPQAEFSRSTDAVGGSLISLTLVILISLISLIICKTVMCDDN